ncbi:hypothetical protein HN51_048090 [Arachis hypogaea]
MEASNQFPDNDNKRCFLYVEADYKVTSFALYVMERRRMHSETLFPVFDTYFCILKHTMHVIAPGVPYAPAGSWPSVRAANPIELHYESVKSLYSVVQAYGYMHRV